MNSSQFHVCLPCAQFPLPSPPALYVYGSWFQFPGHGTPYPSPLCPAVPCLEGTPHPNTRRPTTLSSKFGGTLVGPKIVPVLFKCHHTGSQLALWSHHHPHNPNPTPPAPDGDSLCSNPWLPYLPVHLALAQPFPIWAFQAVVYAPPQAQTPTISVLQFGGGKEHCH